MKNKISEICPELFCIEIPLPDRFLKSLNAYVIRSPDKNLIIDTGFNTPEAYHAMTRGLDHIGVSLDRSDIFITHSHADHFDMVPRLKRSNTRVYFNGPEISFLEKWQGMKTIAQRAFTNGFPPMDTRKAASSFPELEFDLSWLAGVHVLSQGSLLSCGPYRFFCIDTPGHSPGHICLYDEKQGVLVSGDHVLMDISPNIQCLDNHDNPLADYLASLEKVRSLKVDIVLPAHRRQFSDLDGRAGELISHHLARLDELRHIINAKPLTAYEAAREMDWDIKADNWDDFPDAQKWFAMGEALSHLRFLEARGEVCRIVDGNLTRYGKLFPSS